VFVASPGPVAACSRSRVFQSRTAKVKLLNFASDETAIESIETFGRPSSFWAAR
jgi:hypothetical protein